MDIRLSSCQTISMQMIPIPEGDYVSESDELGTEFIQVW